MGQAGTVARQAEPVEFFRIENNRITIPRRSQAVAVIATPPPYEVEVAQTTLTLVPGETAEVPVTIRRQGYNKDITLMALGLPDGVRAEAVTVRGNRSEGVVRFGVPRTVRFGRSADPRAYRLVIAGAAEGDGFSEGLLLCSQPLRMTLGTSAASSTTTQPMLPDPPGRAVFQRRCAGCHAAPDPTRSKRPLAAWTATVDRMIRTNGAQVSDTERTQILGYLQAVGQ
jgi:hypothetical protein